MTWRGRSTPAAAVLALLFPPAACSPARMPDPADAAKSYASAAERGDTAALYAMMTSASRVARSRGELEAMLADEKSELAEQGKALSGPDVRVEASAMRRMAASPRTLPRDSLLRSR